MRFAALVAFGLALAPVQAIAQPVMSIDQLSAQSLKDLDSGAIRPLARDLSELVTPRPVMKALLTEGLLSAFTPQALPELADLEAESPGLMKDLRQEVSKAFAPHGDRMVGQMVDRYSRLFSRAFTDAQLTELVAFFRTETGRKVIAAKFAAVKGTIGQEWTLDPDRPMTVGDVARLQSDTVDQLSGKLDAADEEKLKALSATAAFQRMKAMGPLIARLEAAQGNESEPESEKAVGDAVERVLTRRKLN